MKNIWRNQSYRFQEKCKKRTFNSEKWRHRAEGYATLITSYKAINRLKNNFRVPETMVCNLLTDL